MTQHNYHGQVVTLYGSNSTFNLPLPLSVMRSISVLAASGTVKLPLPSLSYREANLMRQHRYQRQLLTPSGSNRTVNLPLPLHLRTVRNPNFMMQNNERLISALEVAYPGNLESAVQAWLKGEPI